MQINWKEMRMFDDSKKLDVALTQRDEALSLIKRIQDALGT